MASFSSQKDEKHHIHGHSLIDMTARLNFTQAIFYTWTGHMPEQKQEAMFNACLIAFIDHGPEVLSAKASRIAASGGAAMHTAVAAGMLAAGIHHGATVLEDAAVLLKKSVAIKRSAESIVAESFENGERLPGYGHRVYTTDPRTTLLLQKAQELGFYDEHVKLAVAIEAELEQKKGKKICLNVDGSVAAIACALGIPTEVSAGLFLVSRTVGLTMHVAEEKKEKPARQRKGK